MMPDDGRKIACVELKMTVPYADDGMQHSDSIPQLGGMIVTHAVDEYDEEWIWGMR
jgi:hypothetical protein